MKADVNLPRLTEEVLQRVESVGRGARARVVARLGGGAALHGRPSVFPRGESLIRMYPEEAAAGEPILLASDYSSARRG